MAFDSEKWALSFYGVVDERFSVETDSYRLRIYRDNTIKTLGVQRSTLGTPEFYIPTDWDMEFYHNQEKLRKLISSEIRKDAQLKFEQRIRVYASRFNIPYKKVEVVSNPYYKGRFCGDTIKFNMWTICGTTLDMIDYLVCHELAHYYEHHHNANFWKKVEQLFYVWNDDIKDVTGEKALLLDAEFNRNLTYFALMFWGSPSYLKKFYEDGHVENKIPLIRSSLEETPDGRVKSTLYTTFEIKFWR
jgi:hypothetical protein